MEALDLANDLAFANQRIEVLEIEVANWRALAEHSKARLDAIEANWNEQKLPPSPPAPIPISSSGEIPVYPHATPDPEPPPPSPPQPKQRP
jgi:hypothetical protein